MRLLSDVCRVVPYKYEVYIHTESERRSETENRDSMYSTCTEYLYHKTLPILVYRTMYEYRYAHTIYMEYEYTIREPQKAIQSTSTVV